MRTNPALDRVGAHPIATLRRRANEMRAAGTELVDFSIGDPLEPTWPAIPDAVRGAIPDVSQYPTTSGLAELREAVAGYVARRFDVTVDPATQVLPTSGSKEAIFSTALAFVDRGRGDVVVHPDPGYPVYAAGAVMAGAEAHPAEADASFVVTHRAVPAETWDRAAIVWVCTPSNPTGAITPRAELEAMARMGVERGVLVCSDECYVDLYDPEVDPPASMLQVAGTGSEGVLAYFSLSKRSGMTGYRSGAIVGDAEAIERLRRLRTSTGTASPEFVQRGAVVAWSDDEHVAARREVFAAKRHLLGPAFAEAGMTVRASQAGIYLWVDVGSDDVAVAERLLEAGVVVSPGSMFGVRGRRHLRLALVPTLDECRRAAESLRRALSAPPGRR